MELVIQIKYGQPFDHPIAVRNLLAVMPEIDINNLPPQFAKFERVDFPKLNPYQRLGKSTYEWVGGIVKDVHYIHEFTEAEKIEKQNAVKAAWNNKFPSWTFDETTCSFLPPVPYPTDGRYYKWNEKTLSWVYYLDML